MLQIFKDYLFNKHILVTDRDCFTPEETLSTLITLGQKFGIRITRGGSIAEPQMIHDAERNLGIFVPEPFYRGFPQTVRELTPDQLLFDQMYHYASTYGMGWFEEPGHSTEEGYFERLAFNEKTEPKGFEIFTEEEAGKFLIECLTDMLSASRPLNPAQREIVIAGYKTYGTTIVPEWMPCKQTAVEMLYETKDAEMFGRFLKIPDTIKLLDYIQYTAYDSENLKKLNLKNQDRKLIKRMLDFQFRRYAELDTLETADKLTAELCECFEKRDIWKGLLHHIHYQPQTLAEKYFVKNIRNSKKNESPWAEFEFLMAQDITKSPFCREEYAPRALAVAQLQASKGTGAVIRNLDYILSRCQTVAEIQKVFEQLKQGKDKVSPMIFIQTIMHYHHYHGKGARTFRFTKNNRMRVHKETPEEQAKRRSQVSHYICQVAEDFLEVMLEDSLKGRLQGKKVWIDPRMENIAIPTQNASGQGGFDILPTGSRVPIPEGKKIRAFTYWEKVNDIDLSCFGMTEEGERKEFSWRTMYARQGDAITFSGDETSGYNGGSEYFDIDIEKFRRKYPEYRYLIFCDNIYSGARRFTECFCKAGFMERDILDSGEVYEPKTVATSFRMTADSSFGYLFAIDLEKREMIWLNMSRNGQHSIAGETEMGWLTEYTDLTDIISVEDVYAMAVEDRTSICANPADADIIVTTEAGFRPLHDEQEVVHSYDTEKVLRLLQ